MKPEYVEKQKEYEAKKARAKALQLRLTCTICGVKPKMLLNCPCGTTQYCSTECQRIDWRDRGHRKACKKIRNEREAEAARAEAEAKQAEAPAPPPEAVFYGPAPRSGADEIRARIAAEHEAARLRREAEPEPEPLSARWGSRCPICMENWDVSATARIKFCCCRRVCESCMNKTRGLPCPLCRTPYARSDADQLAMIRRHVENEVPEAMHVLACSYSRGGFGSFGLKKSDKKAAKLYKRAVELGMVDSMVNLSQLYWDGAGVKVDEKKSIQLLRLAADRGNAVAQMRLGSRLNDIGCQDLESQKEIVKYFTLAAEQGHPIAEVLVATFFIQGAKGVPKDYEEARRWLERAAAKGVPEAIELLEHDDWDNTKIVNGGQLLWK